jgi:hypothetical protein
MKKIKLFYSTLWDIMTSKQDEVILKLRYQSNLFINLLNIHQFLILSFFLPNFLFIDFYLIR